jgi:hypothetical protein
MSEDHLKRSYLKTHFEQQLLTSDKTEKKIEFYIQMHSMHANNKIDINFYKFKLTFVLFLSKNIIQSNYVLTENNCPCFAEPSLLNYTVAVYYLLSIENIFG